MSTYLGHNYLDFSAVNIFNNSHINSGFKYYISNSSFNIYRILMRILIYYLTFVLLSIFIALILGVNAYNDMYVTNNIYCLTVSSYYLYLKFSLVSSIMLIVVIIISTIVIIYSLYYISLYDYSYYFGYIIIFQFAMIIFVLTNNLLIIFFYWELLGITSFLLINF